MGLRKSTRIVELPNEWVEKELRPDFIKRLKEVCTGAKKGFIDVPLGDCRPLVPSMDCSKNPLIKYPQGSKDTCAFSALASAVHYCGYQDAARSLMDYCDVFYEGGNNVSAAETLTAIGNHYQNIKDQWKTFRKSFSYENLRNLMIFFRRNAEVWSYDW